MRRLDHEILTEISSDEFKRAAIERFRAIDTDGNGVLTPDELFPGDGSKNAGFTLYVHSVFALFSRCFHSDFTRVSRFTSAIRLWVHHQHYLSCDPVIVSRP